MNTVIAMNDSIAIPNHETADTAWSEIKAADTFVKKTMSEINAAEKWITIGVRLNDLREVLARTNQWDKTAPGYGQAFTDGRFGMSYSTGKKFAVIGNVLGSHLEPSKLPSSWRALYELASGFKKNPEKLKLAIRDGKVTPLMSIKEAKVLAGKKLSKKEKEAKPPKGTPMQTFEAKRKEYVRAAKILTAKEREQEAAAVAKELKTKPASAKTHKETVQDLVPRLTAILDKMGKGKRLTAMNLFAKELMNKFSDLDIKVYGKIGTIEIGKGEK